MLRFELLNLPEIVMNQSDETSLPGASRDVTTSHCPMCGCFCLWFAFAADPRPLAERTTFPSRMTFLLLFFSMCVTLGLGKWVLVIELPNGVLICKRMGGEMQHAKNGIGRLPTS